MLQSIRNKSQSWLMWVIIGFIIIMFGLWGVSYYLTGPAPSQKPVAKINGVAITQGQLKAAYDNSKQRLKIAAPTVQQQAALNKAALNGLINEEVMVQQAEQLGVGVSSAQIQALIQQIPGFKEHGVFSPSRLQYYLQSSGLSLTEFEHHLRNQYMLSQMIHGLSLSQFTVPAELARFSIAAGQTRDFSYTIIRPEAFLAGIHLTEQQIAQYYQQHKQDYLAPARVKLAYIELNGNDMAAKIAPTEAQLQAYYQENEQSFMLPARRDGVTVLLSPGFGVSQKQFKQRADAFRQAWDNGESLATLKLAANGLKIKQHTLTNKAWQNKPAVKALFGVSKVGEVSAPIKEGDALVLVKLTAAKAAKKQRYSAVSNKVKAAFIKAQTQQELQTLANRLANITFEYPTSLSTAAKQLGLPVHTTGYFTSNGAKVGVAANKKVVQAAFSNSVLVQNNNSDLIQLGPNHVVVIRALQSHPAAVQSLAQVRDKVIAAAKLSIAKKQAEAKAKSIAVSLQSGKKADSVKWTERVHVKRIDKAVPKQLVTQVFNVPMPSHSQPIIVLAHMAHGVVAVAKVTAAELGGQADKALKPVYQYASEQLLNDAEQTGLLKAARGQAEIIHLQHS